MLAIGQATDATPNPSAKVRVATFNIWELSAEKLSAIDEAGHGTNPQLRGAAEIVQRVRPDVLFVNEIDFDEARKNATNFRDRYLAVGQNGQQSIDYPHIVFEPVNTGVPSGLDFDNDGKKDGPNDAYGYGKYPGQYGMALFSRLPVEADKIRTFQKLLWRDQPHSHLPDGKDGRPEWYGPDAVAALRLSSKSHWDIPMRVGKIELHLLCAHPTPPVFDGEEDRNGRRNFDEVRLWADYLSGGIAAEYIVDDRGGRGGLAPDAAFVILGDLNADAEIGEVVDGKHAAAQLLEHPRVQDPAPKSPGASAAASKKPLLHPEVRTSDFGRIDYTLPSKGLKIAGSGVFWPGAGEAGAELVTDRKNSSDHRLVWVDLVVE
jgi:endonuclease/exonuclease/phosphatase family metal-dependent hydrolase